MCFIFASAAGPSYSRCPVVEGGFVCDVTAEKLFVCGFLF